MSHRKTGSFSRNVLAVLSSGIAPFAVTLITLPILISQITLERYGVLAIVWMITGSVGFIQLGMGRAVVQRLNAAKRASTKPATDLRQSILFASFAITCLTSLIAGSVAMLLFQVYFRQFGVADPQILREVTDSLPLVGFSVVVGFFVNLLLGIYQADERFVYYSLARFLNVAGAQLGPLFAAIVFSPSFSVLMIAIALTRAATAVALFVGIRQDISQSHWRHLSRRTAIDLLSFGGWTSVLAILSPLLVVLDRFIIGATFGVAAVGAYTVAYNLCTRLFVIPTSVCNVILPRLSRQKGAELALTSARGLQVVIILTTPTLVGFVTFYEVFVSHWMSVEIAAETNRIAAVLAVGVLSASLGQAPYTQLIGEGKVRAITLWHLAQVSLYVPAVWLALNSFGLVGAAYAWSLRTFIDAVGLFHMSQMPFQQSQMFAFLLVIVAAITQLVLPHQIQRLSASLIVLAIALVLSGTAFMRVGRQGMPKRALSKSFDRGAQ
jgi:O-antigen/teichoic acid export membrane protein